MEGTQSVQKGPSAMNQSNSKQLTDQLFDAIFDEDIDRVEVLINEGADVNAERVDEKRYKRYDPITALSLAANKNNEELVRALLQSPNIDVNRKDCLGDVALHFATSNLCLEVVEALLATKKADVNVGCKKYGITPLHLASTKGHEEIVEALLKYPGIQVNQKDHSGSTALHGSAKRGHTEVVDLLLDVPGILVNEKNDLHNHTPLHLATDFRHEDTVEALLSHPDIDVNVKDKYGQTPLHTSAYHGDLKVVEMLLEAGIDANAKHKNGQTAVYLAAKKGHTKVVEKIVKHLKDVVASGGNISHVDAQTRRMKRRKAQKENIGDRKANDPNAQLLSGAANNDLCKVEELLKDPTIHANSVDKNKNTPLHLASQKGHIEIVKMLLQVEGIDVNLKNRDKSKLFYPIHRGDNPARAKLDIGKTPLHLAVDGGHLEVVKILLNHPGIDVNAIDKYNTFPLLIAVKHSHIEMLQVLLNHPKIEVNAIDVCNDHFSLLHIAVEKRDIEVVKMLLSHPNINVNIKEKFHRCTPLDMAIRNNDLQIVEAILNHPKVDVNVLNKFNDIPLYNASENGNADIIKRLIEAKRSRCGKTSVELPKRNM